ncbi:CaiB/BaiF CoA transferase family protein [Acuticoccus kandeliae]|uniref:CaiB/BaiF CoA transferase family protein n=1 Tax=Acuticoccus kandeliae TaxID=2073160 RepID=UPI000D3E66EE|nr:CoA transferase [Acuticoccus kandeliae]
MSLPLENLRVLDLTNVMAGPFCCYQLAMLGAEVIKVERPGSGDLARELGADSDLNRRHMGASFLAQNAGKKSVTLDMKSPKGQALFLRLVDTADAVVESFRPGVMARLGASPAALRARNPRLVVCSLSGFGQTGPYAKRPAYDQIIQGLSGIMSVTGDADSAPLRVGFPVADAVTGLTAAMSVSAALAGAARTGEGSIIDVSMLDSTMVTSAWVVSNYLITGQTPAPMGNENRTAAPSGTFRTKDGLLNIAANRQSHWESVAKVLGVPELIEDPRFKERESRKANRAELKTLLEEVLMGAPAQEWEERLNAAHVPTGRVLSVPDAIDHPQVRHRGLFREFATVPGLDRSVRVANGGFVFEGEDRADLAPPAQLGAHNGEIFAELGVSQAEIEALKEEGIL